MREGKVISNKHYFKLEFFLVLKPVELTHIITLKIHKDIYLNKIRLGHTTTYIEVFGIGENN